MLCSACAHGLHLYHSAASETEECTCHFCTLVSEEDEAFLREIEGLPPLEPVRVENKPYSDAMSTSERNPMNNVVEYIKANKVKIAKTALIAAGTATAIALVAYAYKRNLDGVTDLDILAETATDAVD